MSKFITLERSMTEDLISVRWEDIRAITGAVLNSGPPTNEPYVQDGACTIYMEGELGFIVNHTREEVLAMMAEAANVAD